MPLHRPLHWSATLILSLALICLPQSGAAEGKPDRGRRLEFIRDAEIEYNLRAMTTPLMRVAGIDPDSVQFVLVQDNVLNAFVAGGMNVFLFTGLIQATESPSQLIGVIAHELGHISGGHLVRGTEAMRNASIESILGMIAGLAAGILAKNSQAGMATIGGTQELAERNYFGFSRAVEGSADAAGMRFLDRAGFSARGLYEFIRKLKGREFLSSTRQSQYTRTHPLTQDRIDAIFHHIENSPYSSKKLPDEYEDMYSRTKAKLLGFLQPENALLRYTDSDPRAAARYARAIAFYRTNQLDKAETRLNALIREEPRNPFYHELRGQMLYENGRIAESIQSYRQAVALLPEAALLQAAFGQALLQSDARGDLDDAITHLLEAVRLEPQTPGTWHGLATAWGRKAEARNNDKAYRGMTDYALAEEALARGADDAAQKHAEAALKNLPANSPYRIRAQDIRLIKEKKDD
ncbi:MAG: M48 family metalloprotease [Alphaproteobacteria bacterium]